MSKVEVNQISSQCGSTLTIGQSGDTVTLAAGATQTGFGRTGTVDWDTTAKTASFTAVSGNGYFVNTTSGAITVTLPASPSGGDIVAVKDYAQTFATNNVTLARNGSNIEGVASDQTLNGNAESVTFVYVDSTKGWVLVGESLTQYGPLFISATGGTITTCGNYKIHTFTSPGTFTVCSVGNPAGSDTVDYLVVAGGGGGGGNLSGGGGAGGMRFSSCTYTAPCASVPRTGTALPVSASPYPIAVGAGGGGVFGDLCITGGNGSNSVFSTITSTGGGGGGSGNAPRPSNRGNDGGSGGGNTGYQGPGPAGAGNTPPVSPSQGNPGGSMITGGGPAYASSGGGGAGADGTDGSNTGAGAPGGDGLQINICGTNYYYSGGGGGGSYEPSPKGGDGGNGGGGGGSTCTPGSVSTGGPGRNAGGPGSVTPGLSAGVQAGSGGANTGGGGGGASHCGGGPTGGQGGNGGSGIVIIRYKYQ